MATLAWTLISSFEDWLKKAEEAEERKAEPYGGQAIKTLAVEGLFTQMGLVIQCLQSDPEGWKEVGEFCRQATYKSQAVRGCISVMRKISEVFVSKS